MNFEKFILEIKKMVKEYLGNEVKVEDKSVLKNNGVKFTGIVILKENQNCVPNIYLNGYFEQYQRGRGICDIVCEILRYYEEKKNKKRVNIDCFSNFDPEGNTLYIFSLGTTYVTLLEILEKTFFKMKNI
mgnify:CR=1 FL=1